MEGLVPQNYQAPNDEILASEAIFDRIISGRSSVSGSGVFPGFRVFNRDLRREEWFKA